MPAYSYKERFIQPLMRGLKCQTIRKRRLKGFAQKGDTLYHYFGLRTKWCKKLGESICKDVKTIIIKKDSTIILFDRRLTDAECKKALKGKLMGVKLSAHAIDELADDDGFRAECDADMKFSLGTLMLRWWKQTHTLPFIGDLIMWDRKTFTTQFDGLLNSFKPAATGSGK